MFRPPPHRRTFPPFLLVLGIMLGPHGIVGAETAPFYSLRMAAFPSEAAALDAKASLELAGYQPVSVELEDASRIVVFGVFENYVDALLYKNDLRGSGAYPEAYVIPSAASLGPASSARGPLAPVFQLEVESVSAMPVARLTGDPIYEQLEAIDRNGTAAEYRAALTAALPNHSAQDPVRGYIMTNLGIQDLLAGDYESAMANFTPVADGTVASAAAHRVMAMIRMAWIWHRQADRVRAYQAYREIEKFTGSEAVRARCQVECIGLLMELAESAKGTHLEMRRAAEKALSEIPESMVKQRAVIELMVMESYARQPERDLDMAISLGQAFEAKYTPHRETVERELAAAVVQLGLFYYWKDDLDSALQKYQQVLGDFPPNADQFAGANPHAQAMLGLSNVFRKQGNIRESNQIRKELLMAHPDDDAARKVRAIQPWLEN